MKRAFLAALVFGLTVLPVSACFVDVDLDPGRDPDVLGPDAGLEVDAAWFDAGGDLPDATPVPDAALGFPDSQ